ncbi:hypothetical protein C8R46DRAFT_65798 [Mycena filopes]|nr:hypothetical protein C8R46DRAFT_65798 [Mycena filopes]
MHTSLCGWNPRIDGSETRQDCNFLALQGLFDTADNSVWFSAAQIDTADFDRDPNAERSSTITVPLDVLKTEFLLGVRDAAVEAQPDDTIVLVLCGRGVEGSGNLVIGGEIESRDSLSKEQVERALAVGEISRSRTFVISNASFSGYWTSPHWTLFAAPQSLTSVATTQSGYKFIDQFRNTLGPIDASTHELPSHLHLLEVVNASPPTHGATRSSGISFAPLTSDEAKELQHLATEYNKTEHAPVAIDVSVNATARKVACRLPVPDAQQRILLAKLRYRARECRRATAIAEHLGWAAPAPVSEWGEGNGLERMMEAEASGAEIATNFFLGVRGAVWWDAKKTSVNVRPRPWKTMGPGAWLADVWVRAGKPVVEQGRWAAAVAHANQSVD